MKVEIDLAQDGPQLSDNAQRAEDHKKERERFREYNDETSPEEIRKKEEEDEKLQKEKAAQDNPPAPSDLGKFKPEKFETLEQQLEYVDRETTRKL